MTRQTLKHSLRISSPVFFGYTAIGIGFGILLSNAGYPWWLATLMSIVMYTGAGQYFAVGQLAAKSSLAEIMLVQLLLSLRHIFYGLSLLTKYRKAGKVKPYLIFAITDETFALVQGMNLPEKEDMISVCATVSLLNQIYWTVGSTLGAVSYRLLEHYNLSQYLEGVDFALTSLFIVLLIEQLKATRDWLSVCAGAGASLAAVILFRAGIFSSSNIIWTAICAGTGILLLVRGPRFFRENSSIRGGEK